MNRPQAKVRALAVLTLVAGLLPPAARSQQMTNFDRERVLSMLDDISNDVKRHYYDPKFHGVDWDGTVREARQQIKSSSSLNLSMAHLAQALASLDDSHTFFLPPSRPYVHSYCFQTEMIGDRCYVIRVRPGSDAESKGVKPGDEVRSLEGYQPERASFWKMEYRYNLLRPEPGLRLVLRDVQGQQRQVDVASKFKQTERVHDVTGDRIWDVVREMEDEEHLNRARWAEAGEDAWILKLPVFDFDQSEVDSMMGKARKRSALILDLRGNPGGAVETLKYVVADMFEDEVKIADRAGRKELKPEKVKPRGHNVFTGKLIVLIDSKSASASEIFARLVQLQKRGTVLGDRSSGSVMEAKRYSHHLGADTMIFFGASITESDLIMSDGKSLEHTGVTPDEIVLPTSADLASGRDPVLARAAAILGAKLSPDEAGKMFPYEWPKE
jgi:carboxyl-terminal processing protease